MILGRNAGLWVGLVAAALNAAVLVFGLPLNADQVAILNILAASIIAVVANESDKGTVPTFAPTLEPPQHDRRADDPPSATPPAGQP